MNVLSLISAKITHLVAATSTDNYFQNVASNIEKTLGTLANFIYIAAAIAVAGIGVMCIIGSERSKEMAKSKFVQVVIGVGLVVLAVTVARGITGMFTSSPS